MLLLLFKAVIKMIKMCIATLWLVLKLMLVECLSLESINILSWNVENLHPQWKAILALSIGIVICICYWWKRLVKVVFYWGGVLVGVMLAMGGSFCLLSMYAQEAWTFLTKTSFAQKYWNIFTNIESINVIPYVWCLGIGVVVSCCLLSIALEISIGEMLKLMLSSLSPRQQNNKKMCNRTGTLFVLWLNPESF
jgi:hypothetical protein